MPSPRITAEVEQRILDLFAELGNKTQVARSCGVSRNTVHDVLARAERDGRPAGFPTVVAAPVAAAPAPFPEVPEEYKEAFREWLKANGMPVPAETKPTHPPGVEGRSIGPIVRAQKAYRRVAFLSDIHIPYHNRVHLRLSLDHLADWKPDLVVLGGDCYDCYDISDYDRSPGRASTLQDEFDAGMDFVREVDSLGADVVFLEGNHENRLERLVGKNPGLYKLRSLEFRHAAQLPERWECYRSQAHYHVGPLAFLHGDVKGMSERAASPAATMFRRLKTSAIFGHVHRFDSYYDTGYDGTIRGCFSNGFLGDERPSSYVGFPNWQPGFTRVEFSADQKLFRVEPVIIINQRLVIDGKEYAI